MQTLKQTIQQAQENKTALGHFNIANLEMLKGVFLAVQEKSKSTGASIPVIIGLSESERKYIGAKQAVAFIKNLRTETDYPIFINADHCHSHASALEAAEAGFDALVIDNSKFSLAENIAATKKTVSQIKENYPDILTEGEIGFIGGSSKLLDEIPANAKITDEQMTTPEEAAKFVRETGVDLLAPAVGNLHGVLKSSPNPCLNISRIKELAAVVATPLVLHGGSGISDDDIKEAVAAGMAVVHISTDLRVAYRSALQELSGNFFQNNPDEFAPYKIMEPVITAVQKAVAKKLNLFS
ncbi:MAG: class II fructose-bisphosphate aldolase [Candidatus Pacebacteria bacterium]|nr:class II fructose-bisphosphate aldolase [Candidatus Paceibacterota bacterium]